MARPLHLRGAIPAALMPFREDLAIDEGAYRRHLRWLADVRGVEAIVVNGHAAEVTSLEEDEQQRALAIAAETVGGRVKLIAGIFTDSTATAVRLARGARVEGADAVLVAPPALFIWGVNARPEVAYRHLAAVAASGDL